MSDAKPNPLKEGKDTSEGKLARSTGWVAIAMMIAGLVVTYLPGLHESLAEGSTAYAICGMLITVAGLVVKLGSALGYTKARTALKVPLLEALKAENNAKSNAIQRAALREAREVQAGMASKPPRDAADDAG
jgi:hypothetical protein